MEFPALYAWVLPTGVASGGARPILGLGEGLGHSRCPWASLVLAPRLLGGSLLAVRVEMETPQSTREFGQRQATPAIVPSL